MNSEAITCPKCGKTVCEEHFNKSQNACVSCASEYVSNNEQTYIEELKKAYADGRVDFGERKALNALAEKLGLSKDVADGIESRFLSSQGSNEEFLPHEKLAIEEAKNLLLSENESSAASKLEPLYQRLNSNEEYLSLYLRCLKKANPNKAIEIIKSFNADFEAACEVEACIHIANDNIVEMDNVVNKMKRFFPQSVITACVNILYLCEKYRSQKEDSVLGEIKSAASALQDSEDKYEQMLIKEAKRQAEQPDVIFCKYTEVPNIIKNAKNARVTIVAEGKGEGLFDNILNELQKNAKIKPTLFSIDLSNCSESFIQISLGYYIKNVISFSLPKGITIVSNRFPYKADALEEIIIPEGVEEIGESAFRDCSKLKKSGASRQPKKNRGKSILWMPN